MEYRRLGRSGLEVSEIGMGSWLTLGSRVDVAATTKLVTRAFELGINFFDTADVYANGKAERALGESIRGLPRHQLVVATKCFFAMSDGPNDRVLSRKHVVESVEGSLERLGLGYIDLHQCHRADPETPMEETVRAYSDLIRQGKLLYWGVSEWSAELIDAACEIADAVGGVRPISNQPNYSIMRRGIEAQILPTSLRCGLSQVVFSPLGQGVLTGKYGGGAVPRDSRAADLDRSRWMGAYLEADAIEKVAALRPLATREGLSMAQLALAFCLSHEGVASVIIGATKAAQLEDNVGAAGRTLSPETLSEIDALFPAEVP